MQTRLALAVLQNALKTTRPAKGVSVRGRFPVLSRQADEAQKGMPYVYLWFDQEVGKKNTYRVKVYFS